MRVLDVGCADGAMLTWLAEQFPGVDLRCDGLDLSPPMIAAAQVRAAEAGVPGSYKVGDAHDVDSHFDAGSYDAVLAYEVIEHVPDMDRLLAALEAMLKPGGRVYLSTPDGTFGAGGNPHHLRAMRAVDLADLLRHRGQLVNMGVGSDAVSFACYTPGARREDVAIYTGPSWMPWSPLDIEEKGLGGSETAAVRLAESLSALGYVVTVFGDVTQMVYRDVIFRHHTTFDPLEPRGLLISSRMPEVFDRVPAATTTFLWVHDVDCDDRLTDARLRRIDHVLTLSGWHEQHVRGRYPFAAHKVRRIRNGIHPPYFKPLPVDQRAQRLIYTSSPDRGLDVLLELWPRVLEAAPDAVFAFCYPDVYNRVAQLDPAVGAHHARVAALVADLDNVQPLGSLPQHELARLMCSSRVWCHPSWITAADAPFHETSCIGALEAQAAGCLVVASDWGALSESVITGRKVNSDPGGPRWRDALVSQIIEGLTNDEVSEWALTHGPLGVADRGWDGVAEMVHGLHLETAGKARKVAA